jgi:hypothetical protein
MSGEALDDLDDFFAAEAVVMGEFDELPCPCEATVWRLGWHLRQHRSKSGLPY